MATLSLNKPIIKKTSAPFIAPKKKEYIIEQKPKSATADPESFFKKKPDVKKKPTKEKVPLTKKQQMKQTLNFICKTYPKVFNRVKPKPLMIGIKEALIAEMEKKSKHVRPKMIKRALLFYVYSINYRKCFAKHNNRIDLEGNVCGEVTAAEKEHAAEALKIAQESMKKEVV